MGEIYREQKKAKGGEQHHKNPTGNVVTPVVATLADLKISKKESSDAQKMAKLSEDKFEGAIAVAKKQARLVEKHFRIIFITLPENSKSRGEGIYSGTPDF